MPAKRITARALIKAIRKNGYEQAFGGLATSPYIEGRPYKGAACAYGQALLNLGIPIYSHEYVDTLFGERFKGDIFNMNDLRKLPLDKIADELEEKYADKLSRVVLIVWR